MSGLGVSAERAKQFAVFSIITGTAFLASPATAGYVALAIVGELILFYLVKFIPTNMWSILLATAMTASDLVSIGNTLP
jgi:hypothetical protein